MNLIKNDEKWFYLNFACDSGLLTVQELGLYAYLLRRVDHKKGYAYPSYEELLNNLNITSRNTLAKYIQGLEEKGFIARRREGMGLANSYYFMHYDEIPTDNMIKNRNSSKINNISRTKNQYVPKNDTTYVSKNDTIDVPKNDTPKENIKENIKVNNSIANAQKDESNQNTILIINRKEKEYKYTQDDIDNYKEELSSYLSDSHTSDKFFTWYEYDEVDDYSKFYDTEVNNNTVIAKRK